MDLNKIQKGLWVACIILSLICMCSAAWACFALEGDVLCGFMAVVFAVAAFWGFKKVR